LKRNVTSLNVTDASNLIIWSDSARRNNAALNVQTNIISKNAWCLWIKDVALTATKIINSEDAFVSNDDNRWNRYQKSTETDWSNI